jgi:gliding motility-associated-like protein
VLGIAELVAQSNTVSVGGEATGSGGTASFTAGEVFYIYNFGGAISITEGMQQHSAQTILNTSISEVLNLEANVGDGEILLSWEIPQEYFGDLLGYKVEISDNGYDFKLVSMTGSLGYAAIGLQNSQKYWCRVSAFSELTLGNEKVIGPLIPLTLVTSENNAVETQVPGEFKLVIDGKEEEIFLDTVNDTLVFESGSLKLQLASYEIMGSQLQILDSLLLIVPDGVTKISGEGFKPNTAIAVWLVQNLNDTPSGRILEDKVHLKTQLSEVNGFWQKSSRIVGTQMGDVYYLGYADVDESGRFQSSFAIPESIKFGAYTFQITGIAGFGSSMALNLGAVFIQDTNLDSDGDGIPDLYEFIQGTDPKNAIDFQDGNGDGVADYIGERSILEIIGNETIMLPWGMAAAEINLPMQVVVKNGLDQSIVVKVNWDISTLDIFNRGNYLMYGEIELPEGMFNAYNLSANLEVVILPKPAPLDVTLNDSVFKGEGNRFFIPVGGFLVIDPVDDIHSIKLLGKEYDNSYFELKENILFWSSSERAEGKTVFTVIVRVTDRDGNFVDKNFEIQRTRKNLDELEVFNTFTPNGDGINDGWGVPDLRFYQGVTIQIFQRSGERVFYTEDPGVYWDGNVAGKSPVTTSFIYVISVGETGQVRRGMLNSLTQ